MGSFGGPGGISGPPHCARGWAWMRPAESSLSTASCLVREEESESAQVTDGGAVQEPQEFTVRPTHTGAAGCCGT